MHIHGIDSNKHEEQANKAAAKASFGAVPLSWAMCKLVGEVSVEPHSSTLLPADFAWLGEGELAGTHAHTCTDMCHAIPAQLGMMRAVLERG